MMLIVLTMASVNQDILAQPIVGAGQVPGSQNPSGTVLAARWRGFGNNVQRRIYVGWGNIGSPGPTGGATGDYANFCHGYQYQYHHPGLQCCHIQFDCFFEKQWNRANLDRNFSES